MNGHFFFFVEFFFLHVLVTYEIENGTCNARYNYIRRINTHILSFTISLRSCQFYINLNGADYSQTNLCAFRTYYLWSPLVYYRAWNFFFFFGLPLMITHSWNSTGFIFHLETNPVRRNFYICSNTLNSIYSNNILR